MRVIIDRIEGDYAIIELSNRTTCNLPLILIPNSNEGDVITIEIDRDETEKRKELIANKAKALWKK